METYSSEVFAAIAIKCPDAAIYRPSNPILGRPGIGAFLSFVAGASVAIIRHRRAVDILLLGDVALTPLAYVAKMISPDVHIVVVAHGNDVYFSQHRNLVSRLYRACIKLFSQYADLLIANSLDTQSVAGTIGFLRTARVPLGTRIPRTTSIGAPNVPSVLFAGRLVRCKGLAWFIENVVPKLRSGLTSRDSCSLGV